jgi:NADP-dependent 3-hydroxy acid dehydrogenase YdfG
MNKPEVVVVTGAGAGLGRAIVQAFARRGARIGLVARGRDRLEDARREVEVLGGRALVIAGDVADPATTEEAAARTEEALRTTRCLGQRRHDDCLSPVAEMTPEDYRRVTEVTRRRGRRSCTW